MPFVVRVRTRDGWMGHSPPLEILIVGKKTGVSIIKIKHVLKRQTSKCSRMYDRPIQTTELLKHLSGHEKTSKVRETYW